MNHAVITFNTFSFQSKTIIFVKGNMPISFLKIFQSGANPLDELNIYFITCSTVHYLLTNCNIKAVPLWNFSGHDLLGNDSLKVIDKGGNFKIHMKRELLKSPIRS